MDESAEQRATAAAVPTSRLRAARLELAVLDREPALLAPTRETSFALPRLCAFCRHGPPGWASWVVDTWRLGRMRPAASCEGPCRDLDRCARRTGARASHRAVCVRSCDDCAFAIPKSMILRCPPLAFASPPLAFASREGAAFKNDGSQPKMRGHATVLQNVRRDAKGGNVQDRCAERARDAKGGNVQDRCTERSRDANGGSDAAEALAAIGRRTVVVMRPFAGVAGRAKAVAVPTWVRMSGNRTTCRLASRFVPSNCAVQISSCLFSLTNRCCLPRGVRP
jgi:hypothetical protein